MVGLGAGIASAGMPACSFAGTVTSSAGDVRYTADTGETNNVTVDLAGGTYAIKDTGPGVTLTATAPCLQTSPTTATCPQAAQPSIDHVTVVGGDMNDTITMNATPRDGTRIDGGAGDDTIVGSTGADKITGGPGDDVIDPNDVTTTINMDQTGVDAFCSQDSFGELNPNYTDVSMMNCPDIVDGESGFNTLRFDHKNGVIIDAGVKGADPEAVTDPTRTRNGDRRENLLATKGRGWRFNKLVGTTGNDQIIGSSNNDTLVGRGGADLLCGGPGNDTVDYSGSGGSVNVTLDTALPPDPKWESRDQQVVSFSRSDCRQTNGSGNIDEAAPKDCVANDGMVGPDGTPATGEHDCVGIDVENVVGSSHNDVLIGSDPGRYVSNAAFFEPRGMNVLNGGGGDDFLDGGLGADVLIGGPGNDTVSYANEGNEVQTLTLDATGGTFRLTFKGAQTQAIAANAAPAAVQAALEGLSTIGPGNVQVAGAAGGFYTITFVGSLGAAQQPLITTDATALTGGAQTATVVRARPGGISVKVTLDGVANDGSSADLNPDSGLGDSVGADVENIIGSSGNDTLVGSDAPNVIQGGPGNDIIQGGGDTDTLDGGAGNDFLQGQAGDDHLLGGAGDDILDGGTGKNTFSGGDGQDAVDYSNNTTSVVSIPDGVANDGNNGGAQGDNVGADVEDVYGGSGNDTLMAGTDGGVIDGGPGNDTLLSGPGSDLIIGGDGIDNVSYAGRAGPVTVDLASGTGGAPGEGDELQQIEQVTGGNGNDSISGNDAVNILDGGPGNDTIDGRGGDDQIFGGPGNDVLRGGAGNDTIDGGTGDDVLQGDAGADTLAGGDGNDQLDGGAGADSLAGGPGDDTAVYSSRSKDVSVSTDGADNDGEANERDQVRLSVESVKTGAGNDTINVRDGVKGEVSCGPGKDSVTADQNDTIAADCEQKNLTLGVLATCTVESNPARMSRSGTISVRVKCPTGGKATLALRTVGKAKRAKKLGSKAFTLKAGKRTTVKIKLSGAARRLVKKNQSLRAHATVTVKGAVASSAAKRSENLTIMAPKKGKR
jgi:Ca2+-binding RTX toxin-like protein